MIVNVTSKNFEEEVLKSDKPVLVDFWASWCGPCKMVSPLVDELAEEHSEYKFCKLNVDDETALAVRYNVMSIPTLMIFKNGEIAKQSVGAIPKEQILKLFE